MREQTPKLTEQEFNNLLLNSIDEALSSLGKGVKNAVYYHLEKKFHIKPQDIPTRIDEFTQALETIFGSGSQPIELLFMEKLHCKTKHTCKPIHPEDLTFPNYVKALKENATTRSHKENAENAKGKCRQPPENVAFVALLNAVVDPLAIVDMKGNFLFINNAMEKTMGISSQPWIGKCFLQLPNIPPSSKKVLLENLQRRSQGKPIEPYEVDIVDGKGEAKQFEINANKIDYVGQTADLVLCRDITQRKSLEMQLKEYAEKLEVLVDKKTREIKEKKARLRTIIDSSPNAIVVTDSNISITDCNQATLDMLGYKSKKEVIGKSGFDFIEEKERAFVQSFKNDIPNLTRNLRYNIIHKNGHMFPCEFSISALKDPAEKLAGFVIVAQDITEREKMEEALRNEEKRFRDIVGSTGDLIWETDTKGKFTFVSPVAERLLGYTPNEMIGKPFYDLFFSPQEKQKYQTLATSSTGKEGEGFQGIVHHFLRKNGETVFLEASGSPFFDEAGKFQGFRGANHDITELKNMELKVREAENRYHALFNRAPMGILVIDPETTQAVDFNREAHRQLGYSKAEFAKLRVSDYEAIETPEEIRRRMKKILVQGRDQFKSKHRTKNGELRDIENTVQMIELQGKMFYQVLTRDVTESEQAKAALVKSERGYRQLIETAQEGVWALDTNYVTVLANPRMAEMLGCTQTEMLGKSLFEFLDKQRSEEVKNFLKNHKDGFSGHHEYGLVRKDGTCLYGSISFSPIKNEAEECIGCLALVADNTERKKLEDELRDSEEKFRVMSTFASDAILLIDETDEIIYWNLAAERIFGYTKEEAVGKKLGQLVISPECRQKHCESVEKIMKHERLFPKTRMERKCLKKDGTELQIELSASAVNLKDKPCLLGLVRDVTERAKLEAALKQEREMLEKMAANIGAGLTIISKDYRILWANQLLKQVHKGPIENKHCYTIYDKNGKICPDCGVKKVFENGVDVDRHDYFFKDAQGKDSWVELIVTPVKDEDGNVVSALELAIGINERKQMQTKLAQYSQRLAELVEERTEQLKQTQAKLVKSERLAAIGELAGMVGHDLRNPLTSIKAASYFINARYSQLLDATGNDMLATIEKSINYSNKIINDLLDYSRDIKLEAVETTPKAMLKTALSLIELPPNTKIVDLTEDAPQMKTDMAKMSRVFVNIIKNASDAMPNGGTLTITSKTTDTHIEITFADTGTGMSRATLRKLWTPLFTTKAKGMGFGLPICKRIVETHGGRILVDSKLGKGTVFTISLPKMLPPKAEADEEWIFVPPQPATALNQAKKAK